MAEEHVDSITKAGLEVQKKWRSVTDKLNAYMSNGTRKNGRITHPDKKEEIRPDIFAEEIRNLYKLSFAKMRQKLAESVMPKIAEMYADSAYAAKSDRTVEDAKSYGERLAAKRIEFLVPTIAEDDSIPVKLEDDFSTKSKQEMWKAWRSYLITKDIVERVVPASVIEVKRTLAASQPLDPAARDAAKAKAEANSDIPQDTVKAEQKVDKNRVEWVRKGWRWIDSINSISVSDVTYGNAELPAFGGGVVNTEKPEGEAAVAVRNPENGEDDNGYDSPEDSSDTDKNGLKYHDTYTVTIDITAHMGVIQAFMKNILDAKGEGQGMFYVPASCTITRLEEAQVMGDYTEAEKKRWSLSGGVGSLAVGPSDPQKLAGFEYEPPVNATLVYQVYRFRYADTDNGKSSGTKAVN